MKISEFLQDLFKLIGTTESNFLKGGYILTPELLKIPIIKEGLLRCEEFKDTKELVIMDYPIIEIETEEGLIAEGSVTMMISRNIKFKEKVYLHSIFLSSEMYDTNEIHRPVKDNVCITPMVNDPITFSPLKSITVFFSPERLQDESTLSENQLKEKLIEQFKMALENPEDYTVKGYRCILMRGLMERSVVRNEEEGQFSQQIVKL